MIFGFQTSAISQRGHSDKNGKIEHLKSSLELTDAQTEELKTVFETLREDTETTTREEKKIAMDKAVAEVLTEEQLAKFQELKSDKRGLDSKRSKARNKKGRAQRGLAKDDETTNRLKEMRTELDESISADDKLLIVELRESFADRKKNIKGQRGSFKDLSDDEKKALKESKKIEREAMKADVKQLKTLTKVYESEIKSLFEENETFFEEKKAEQKEEWKAKKEEWKKQKKESKENRENGSVKDGQRAERKATRGDRANHRMGRSGHLSKGAKFLLMDPNADQEDVQELARELNTISVSPNPAATMTNVTYEVKNAGPIRVEIRDESGRVYEVIANETLEAGTYTRAVETSRYQDKTYYISISDGKSIKTEKLMIQK